MTAVVRRVQHAVFAARWWLAAIAPFFLVSVLAVALPGFRSDTLLPIAVLLTAPALLGLFGATYIVVRELVTPGGIQSRRTGAVVGFVAGVAAMGAVGGPPGPPLWVTLLSGAVFAVLGMAEAVRNPPETTPAG